MSAETIEYHGETTRLCVEMTTLRQMVIQMQSHWGDPCAPPFMSRGPNHCPPPPVLSMLLDLLYLNFES